MVKRNVITLNLKTGMYHIPSINNDHDCFFDILEKNNNNYEYINIKEEEDPKYIYRILHFRRTPDYVLMSLNRINKEAVMEYISPNSNTISEITIENYHEGFVWAYMDKNNNIIIDNNNKISPFRFVNVISKMIDDRIVFGIDCPYQALSGRSNFEVNYDRLFNDEFEHFYKNVEKLTSVTAKARVLSNPLWARDTARDELNKKLLRIGAKKVSFEDKVDGMNKDNEIIQGFVDLSVDGHFDIEMNGTDSSDDFLKFINTPKNDDSYKYPKVEINIDEFGNISKKLMKKVRDLRKSRSDNKITESSNGRSDQNDDHENGP